VKKGSLQTLFVIVLVDENNTVVNVNVSFSVGREMFIQTVDSCPDIAHSPLTRFSLVLFIYLAHSYRKIDNTQFPVSYCFCIVLYETNKIDFPISEPSLLHFNICSRGQCGQW